jgi:hypothetical protein
MRRYRDWLTLGLVLVAWLAMRPAAAFADASVAVLGIEPIGVPESMAAQLTDALKQRVSGTGGLRMVPGKDLIEIKMIFSCDAESPSCMAQAGRSLGVDKLVYGIIKKAPTKNNVSVALKLLDVKTGTVEKYVNDVVSKRELSASQVGGTATRWFGSLFEAEAKPILTVTSDPPGASLTVDGQPMGRTPVTLRDLATGTHTVVLSMAGRASATRSVELRAGGTHDVVVTLEPEPTAQAPVVTPTTPAPAPPPEEEAPPPVTRQPPRHAAAPANHPGRAAKIIGITGMALGVATAGVAIYTWHMYSSDLANQTHNDLVALGPPMQGEQSFFSSPSCNVPSSLQLRNPSGANKYRDDCTSGQTYANATTGLWVAAGVLAAAGVVSFVIGDRQAAKAKDHSTLGVMRRTLRLVPVASSQGGGLQAHFEF